MIEITIPLNLPVRSIAVTKTTASPPEWILDEMTNWKSYHQLRSTFGSESIPSQGLSNPQTPPSMSEWENEIELLRVQRSLFKNAIEEMRHANKLVEQRLESMVHEFQEATVELAHAIASKLIFEEVDSNRFPISNLVHEVVGRLDLSANAVVRLHPDDLAIIQEQPTIGHSDDEEHSLRFIADSTLARGDCRAKAGEISVIYELRRQVDDIRRQILSTVNGHAEA